jgi:cell division protease FtsH
MTEALGPITYGDPAGARYLDLPVGWGSQRTFSEETARRIDAEVRSIMEAEEKRARAIVAERKLELEAIAQRLLAAETINRDELETLAPRRDASLKEPPPMPAPLGDPGHMRPPNGR